MSAALALTEGDHRLASWRSGVLRLPEDWIPCPGMIWVAPGSGGRTGVWRAVRGAMLRFLDDWGTAAAEFGWTTEALFGVHHMAGALRADSTGALVTLYPRRCIALCEREIHLERRRSVVVDRGLTNPAESVPIWAFGTT